MVTSGGWLSFDDGLGMTESQFDLFVVLSLGRDVPPVDALSAALGAAVG
jgi:hypothetical protein